MAFGSFSVFAGMSFSFNNISKGSRTVPCETPDETGAQTVSLRCCLKHRKECIHFSVSITGQFTIKEYRSSSRNPIWIFPRVLLKVSKINLSFHNYIFSLNCPKSLCLSRCAMILTRSCHLDIISNYCAKYEHPPSKMKEEFTSWSI